MGRGWYDAPRALARAARALPGAAGLPPLLALTDPARTPDAAAFAASLPPGCALIYRHFGRAERFETAAALARIARARALTLLIAADPELAQAAGAQGVHWPNARLDEAGAARRRWPRLIVTASAHDFAQLARAARAGADAALLSPVLETQSRGSGPALGALRAAAMARAAALPVYALGGLAAKDAPRLARLGFCGLAGIGLFRA
ncbi:MAG: thiamine phosphate synthase [Maricaulaceae bacterium]|nr:thiamine phosphate synthase [Maricaulaceae bacterium]